MFRRCLHLNIFGMACQSFVNKKEDDTPALHTILPLINEPRISQQYYQYKLSLDKLPSKIYVVNRLG